MVLSSDSSDKVSMMCPLHSFFICFIVVEYSHSECSLYFITRYYSPVDMIISSFVFSLMSLALCYCKVSHYYIVSFHLLLISYFLHNLEVCSALILKDHLMNLSCQNLPMVHQLIFSIDVFHLCNGQNRLLTLIDYFVLFIIEVFSVMMFILMQLFFLLQKRSCES